jgi:hypothetical protein
MQSQVLNSIDQQELPLARKADAVTIPLQLIVKQSTLAGAIFRSTS